MVKSNKISIKSPIKGDVVKLETNEDVVFASGAVGKGVAIIPSVGEVYAPVSGSVSLVFPTKHAIGLLSDEGAEILIHIGMDTVELQGEGFDVFVEAGDNIEQGQLIAKFDMDYIASKDKLLVTPVVVTNAMDYEGMERNYGVSDENTEIIILSK